MYQPTAPSSNRRITDYSPNRSNSFLMANNGGGGGQAARESSDYSRCSCSAGGSSNSGKHVVVVMDALKGFSTKPLEWALEHVVEPGNMLTLLGVMPYLSLPLLCKTWLDIWTLDIGGLSNSQERSEWKNDPKHKRLRTILELCEARGVVLLMKVVMGHPVRLIVLEQTMNLRATWIVFDRYHRKRRSFYKTRIPCNMVMMKEDGQVDVLRFNQPILDSTQTPSSAMSSALATPAQELVTSEEWKDFLENERKRREG